MSLLNRFHCPQSSSLAICVLIVGLVTTPVLLTSRTARAQAYTVTTVATFDGTNGGGPIGTLAADAAGNLFGSTSSAGANGLGTIFEFTAGSSSVTTLASYNQSVSGFGNFGGVIRDSNGNLYGTTYFGGANNYGTVFKLAAGSNTITPLVAFDGAGNGAKPIGGLTLDSQGNLYGTTSAGGANNAGTVFKISAATGTLTTIAAFNGTNGSSPRATLTFDSQDNLYGTTFIGGPADYGTVFKIAAGSNVITTIATFDPGTGADPSGGVTLDSNGNIYGTTDTGGIHGAGLIYRINAGSTTVNKAASFNYADGYEPIGTLVPDGNGNFLGVTQNGGALGYGNVFEFSSSTNTITSIYSFDYYNSGQVPEGGLIAVGDAFYGTTSSGAPGQAFGPDLIGTIFRVSSTAAPEPSSASMLLASSCFGLTIFSCRKRWVKQIA